MSCYHPIRGFRTPNGVVFAEAKVRSNGGDLGVVEVRCGQCVGCRIQRATDWAIRCTHEAQMHSENCFVTLTYGRDKLPAGGSLEHSDFQRFMKRLRKRTPSGVRFYMCGEYGEENERPHYHACLFGVDFRDRKPEGRSGSGELFYSDAALAALWPHGFATVQDFTGQSAGYCTRYIMQKVSGRDAEEVYGSRKAPYNAMSLKPGIGAAWFNKFGGDVFPHDYVVHNGVKRRAPAYYSDLFARSGDVRSDEVEYQRLLKARVHVADQTPERLRVRELVEEARLGHLKRDL